MNKVYRESRVKLVRLGYMIDSFNKARDGNRMAACIPNTEFHSLVLDLRDARNYYEELAEAAHDLARCVYEVAALGCEQENQTEGPCNDCEPCRAFLAAKRYERATR